MPVYETHDTSCEEAWHRTCGCQCAGLCHGWPGAMAVARRSREGKLAEWRKRIDEIRRWQPAVPLARRSEEQRRRDGRVAVDEARIQLALELSEVVDEELSRQGFRDGFGRTDMIWQRTWTLARGIHRDVLPWIVREHRREAGEDESTLREGLAAAHWWCELITWMAGQLDQDRGWIPGRSDDLIQRIGRARVDRGSRSGEPLSGELERQAVDGAWKKVGDLPRIDQPLGLERALLALRVLGTFMCREPEGHRVVFRCCLWPLARHLSKEIRTRLRTAFPEWSDGTPQPALPC